VTISAADVYSMLASFGSKTVTITRPANGATVDVLVAFRQTQATDLAANGAIYQQSVGVIMSAVEIINAAADSPSLWPGVTPVGFPGDPMIPARGDSIAIEGRDRAVIAAHPIYVNGNLVRINLEVTG
jgi:hypothetical protein